MTGLRANELANLKYSDIVYQDGKPTEFVIRHGKGDKERSVEINDAVINPILAYRETQKANGYIVGDEDYIFHTVLNNYYKIRKPVTRLTIYYIIQRIGEKVNMRIYPHMMRHSFITHLVKNGCPIHKVKEAAGRASA